MPAVLADIGPLRRHRAYRRLWSGLFVSGMGSQVTVVAVAYQAYTMTHSTGTVALISVVCLIPTLLGSFGGGSIADYLDRRKLLILTQVLLATSSASLAANALTAHPHLWVLFVAASATAAFQGVDWPTRLAVLPMIVPADDLPAAYALQSVGNNLAVVAGPALAGLVIASFGLATAYLIDVASFGATFVAAVLLPPLRPSGGGVAPGIRSALDGLKYLRTQRLLAATFLLDLNAMVFGMPKAVFPALGIGLFRGGAATVGLLYAAPGAGSLLASVLSGWVGAIRSQGRALVLCMLIWGGAIAAFGIIPVLWIGLALLAVAGGSDIIGGVFRLAILQRSTPDHLQGRLGGAFYAAAVSGNRLGDGESGLAASIGGPQFAVITGGLACIVGTAVLAWRIPDLWHRQPKVNVADASPAAVTSETV